MTENKRPGEDFAELKRDCRKIPEVAAYLEAADIAQEIANKTFATLACANGDGVSNTSGPCDNGGLAYNYNRERDLASDIAICEAATSGGWTVDKTLCREEYSVFSEGDEWYVANEIMREEDARFIAEARIGWPHAIERAIAAEAEVGRLKRELAWHVDMRRDVIDGYRNERADAIAEITRLRAALEFIVKESACRGVNCSWGDDCFGVVANKALNPEVTDDGA